MIVLFLLFFFCRMADLMFCAASDQAELTSIPPTKNSFTRSSTNTWALPYYHLTSGQLWWDIFESFFWGGGPTHSHVLFWGHWYPCFRFFLTSPLGFKARVVLPYLHFGVMYMTLDPPLVLHIPNHLTVSIVGWQYIRSTLTILVKCKNNSCAIFW